MSFSSTQPEGKPKKANPLNDLIDTEKRYVELLTGIIRVRTFERSSRHLQLRHFDDLLRKLPRRGRAATCHRLS
jgi:hypothetical protein